MQMTKLVICWIILLPFVHLYGAYEGTKVYWIWIGGAALSLWWIYKTLVRKYVVPLNGSDYWFLCWLGILTLASVLGIRPADSIIGGDYRHQGVLFFWVLWLVGVTVRFFSRKEQDLLSVGISGGTLVQSVLLIVQKAEGVARPGGTFGEPNAAAGFIALGSVFLLSVFEKYAIPRWVRIVVLSSVAAAIILNGSRTGILVFAVIVAFRVIGKILRTKMQQCTLAVLIFAMGLFGTSLITRPASIYEDRLLFWQYGLEGAMERPLLGYGAESTAAVFDRIFYSHNVKLVDFMIDRSHNVFLDVTLWSGILGLAFFLGWFIVAVEKLIAIKRWDMLSGVVGWLLFALLQPLGAVHWILLILFVHLATTTSSK